MNSKNVWKESKQKKVKAIDTFAKDYIDFISDNKTERECCDAAVSMLEEAGFVELNRLIDKGTKLKAGDKVYMTQMNKSVAAFVIGNRSVLEGLNILGAHIDSPRLDIKQNPLYEDSGLVLLDTHYYGGIKKYQWVALPMALHGVVALKSGKVIEVAIGEKGTDPVIGVSDLLIHLAAEQMQKKGDKVVEGEDLNVLVGSMPPLKNDDTKLSDDDKNDNHTDKEPVKKAILALLKAEYGIEEEDFQSAELCVVPAGPARDYGFDRSMIMGYGHDDKVCAYPSLIAQLESVNPDRTSCCILVDKEEIGSVGATGMHSRFFENSVAEVLDRLGQFSDLALRRTLANSNMLSSDVNSAYDPNYAGVSEKKNTAYFGKGVIFIKYTGSRGKSGSNDASAEYIARLRKIMDDAGIIYQTAELGKVDAGGGGTIAYIMGNYGMNVIDCGVGVQNMHAPYEVISKVDLYEAYRGYKVFLEKC